MTSVIRSTSALARWIATAAQMPNPTKAMTMAPIKMPNRYGASPLIQ